MSSYVTFTCGKADAELLARLLDQMQSTFSPWGGELVSRQGPSTGFYDPSFGEFVELRSFRFATHADAEMALASADFQRTKPQRARFARLDIAISVRS